MLRVQVDTNLSQCLVLVKQESSEGLAQFSLTNLGEKRDHR